MINAASTLILLLVAQHPDPRTGYHVSPLKDFVTMTLAADRDRYYPGERVRLKLTVRNTSNEAVTGTFALDPCLEMTQVLFRTGAGDYQRLRTFVVPPGQVGVEPRRLAVGQEVSEDVFVSVATLKPPTLLLDSVGRYDFRIVFDDVLADPYARLESNVVSVEVVAAPASEREAQAAYTPVLAYLAQVTNGARAYVTTGTMTEAASFVSRFRQSRYSGPVREGLLKWLEARVWTQRATADEVALYEKLMRDIDTTPPELQVEAPPARLWPPNHKLVEVVTTVNVADAEDANPVVKLVSITCDDACVPAKDIAAAEVGTDDREFALRSERQGSGSGRTYTITYSATDASGNEAKATATVVVPHDNGQ